MSRPPLKKSLGQHHLRQPQVARPLVDFLQPAGRRVLEIGPGGGALTGLLMDAGARVLAVELDLVWAVAVRRLLPALAVAVIDALEVSYGKLCPPTLVAGNLPYQVATPIIARVLPHHRQVPRAAFLVQREVAERLAASPGSRAYGALSVLTQARAEVRLLGRVRPGSFSPPPRVESAFVGFSLHHPPYPEARMSTFEELVRRAFRHKRKTLRNALGAYLPRSRVEAALEETGLAPRSRAEELPLAAWLRLYTVLGEPDGSLPTGER